MNNFNHVVDAGNLYWPVQTDQFYDHNTEFILRNSGTLSDIFMFRLDTGLAQEEFSILLGDNTP